MDVSDVSADFSYLMKAWTCYKRLKHNRFMRQHFFFVSESLSYRTLRLKQSIRHSLLRITKKVKVILDRSIGVRNKRHTSL